jgi:hypothetical protein
MKKKLFLSVAALALIAAAVVAPLKPSKADVIVIDLGVVGQQGVVGAQLNTAISLAASSAGKAVAEATSAAIVNNFSSDTTMAVDAAVAGCGCDVIAGVGTILGQSGFAGIQANIAGSGAFGQQGATAASTAVALVNSATRKASITVSTGN